MPLTKGDIVLVPFPFTDLSNTKLRPAIVLWVDQQGQDITVCFISSRNLDQITDDEFLVDTSDPEFAGTGLKVTSKVRVGKVITLNRSLLKRRLGKLGSQQRQKLDRTLIHTFQLNQTQK